jgi:hypothetical protein
VHLALGDERGRAAVRASSVVLFIIAFPFATTDRLGGEVPARLGGFEVNS